MTAPLTAAESFLTLLDDLPSLQKPRTNTDVLLRHAAAHIRAQQDEILALRHRLDAAERFDDVPRPGNLDETPGERSVPGPGYLRAADDGAFPARPVPGPTPALPWDCAECGQATGLRCWANLAHEMDVPVCTAHSVQWWGDDLACLSCLVKIAADSSRPGQDAEGDTGPSITGPGRYRGLGEVPALSPDQAARLRPEFPRPVAVLRPGGPGDVPRPVDDQPQAGEPSPSGTGAVTAVGPGYPEWACSRCGKPCTGYRQDDGLCVGCYTGRTPGDVPRPEVRSQTGSAPTNAGLPRPGYPGGHALHPARLPGLPVPVVVNGEVVDSIPVCWHEGDHFPPVWDCGKRLPAPGDPESRCGAGKDGLICTAGAGHAPVDHVGHGGDGEVIGHWRAGDAAAVPGDPPATEAAAT